MRIFGSIYCISYYHFINDKHENQGFNTNLKNIKLCFKVIRTFLPKISNRIIAQANQEYFEVINLLIVIKRTNQLGRVFKS